jgi:hypothetical protein
VVVMPISVAYFLKLILLVSIFLMLMVLIIIVLMLIVPIYMVLMSMVLGVHRNNHAFVERIHMAELTLLHPSPSLQSVSFVE